MGIIWIMIIAAIVVIQTCRNNLDESIARISRHWFPHLIFFFLCYTIAGYALNNFGVPSLFRDDAELYSRWGLSAMRNSSVIWGHCFATLLLFAIWAFIFHCEALESETADGSSPVNPRLRPFVFANALPLTLLLLGAAAMPAAAPAFAFWDLCKSMAGIALACGILWAVTSIGRKLFGLLVSVPVPLRKFSNIAGNYLSMGLIRPRTPSPITTKAIVPGLGGFVARACSRLSDLRAIGQILRHPPECDANRRNTMRSTLFFVLLTLITMLIFTVWNVIQPSVSIVLILGWLMVFYYCILLWRPWLRFWVVVIVIAYIAGVNDAPYKYTFPGLEHYYGAQSLVPLREAALSRKSPAQLLDPVETLEQWRQGSGKNCRQMVIIATSGGAYRSAYWTALVLDELEQMSKAGGRLAGLNRCIRLLTGASGGMVGAAYYAVLRQQAMHANTAMRSVVDQMHEDTYQSRKSGKYSTLFPISRDSLTPVAQQLAQRDFFDIFRVAGVNNDRGRILESQWGTLAIPFASLREAEGRGEIPSLLLSPLAFSTEATSFAEPLLISNLNTDSLTGTAWRHAIPFFALFPAAVDTFRVGTAVRMNASFPYVSPAIALPSTPPARVVDAGYYENYGLATAASWLFSGQNTGGGPTVMDWINAQALGVTLIQIRAFAYEARPPTATSACHAGLSKGAQSSGLQFITSPLEAIGAVRSSGMNIRNDQQLEMTRAMHQSKKVYQVSFENTSNAGMSWYLTEQEINCMRDELHSQYNAEQWDRLRKIVDGANHL